MPAHKFLLFDRDSRFAARASFRSGVEPLDGSTIAFGATNQQADTPKRERSYLLWCSDEPQPTVKSCERQLLPWQLGSLQLHAIRPSFLFGMACRREGQHFDCRNLVNRVAQIRALPRKQFKQEVKKELTGEESERGRSCIPSSLRSRSLSFGQYRRPLHYAALSLLKSASTEYKPSLMRRKRAC